MSENFNSVLNMLFPDDTEPPYIKEILQQADRPITAGIGAEKNSIKQDTAMRMNNTLNVLKIAHKKNFDFSVRKQQNWTGKHQVQKIQGDSAKIIKKNKGFDRFAAFK
ncbi:hypothetical protein SS50377_26306 [Spironucleus salmonicida]|uniref:Uncharacterized protein n=1 Tax=Spironucleus salmonicida TaxID=348837 RepID=V6LU93_9EUKA|nr:hypothetical protein SS50377_26306 [Spironucleus salmonicida]|eukprot:EST47828.1 Hypothetical protein SS50377_12229 [Spironucleus salmonicida]